MTNRVKIHEFYKKFKLGKFLFSSHSFEKFVDLLGV